VSRVKLSGAAVNDIREIEAYTVQQFGADHAAAFLDKLQASLELIASMPQMGTLRPDIDPSNHAFRYHVVLKNFVIVFDDSSQGIRVARVLHGARNLIGELERNSGDS
jgi:plasmid stabilization system protein ParE